MAVSCNITISSGSYGYGFVDDFSFCLSGPKALPYAYDFERYIVDEGWTTPNASSYTYVTGGAINNGLRGFQLYGGSASNPQYLISSELTGTADAYNVYYKKASVTAWTTYASNLTASTTTINSLDAGTSYNVKVESVCSGQAGGFTTYDFITDCVAATLPYEYGFEDSESNKWNCWDKGSGISIATGSAIRPHDDNSSKKGSPIL